MSWSLTKVRQYVRYGIADLDKASANLAPNSGDPLKAEALAVLNAAKKLETDLTARIDKFTVWPVPVVVPPQPAPIPAELRMIPTSPGVSTLGILVGGGGNLYPNQPAGMTLLTQWDGTTTTPPAGWGGGLGSCGSVQADGGGVVNPLGTGSSIKVSYVAGAGNQCGTGAWVTWGGSWRRLYISYRIYIDPNWDESVGEKLFYVSDYYNTQQNSYFYTREPNLAFRGQKQVGNGANYIVANGFWSGARGTWVNVELLMERETTPGSSNDAKVTLWKNGSLVTVATAVGPMGNLKGMEWYIARNTAHSQDEYFLIGEISIWGKN